jgi:hypothetical protein
MDSGGKNFSLSRSGGRGGRGEGGGCLVIILVVYWLWENARSEDVPLVAIYRHLYPYVDACIH